MHWVSWRTLKDFRQYRYFNVKDVIHAISRMNRGRATRPDGISVEFWKCIEKPGMKWLTGLFNSIFKWQKCLKNRDAVKWFHCTSDIQNCNNYKGIKLLSHTMKVWKRVVEKTVRIGVFISKNQLGFMLRQSTAEALMCGD